MQCCPPSVAQAPPRHGRRHWRDDRWRWTTGWGRCNRTDSTVGCYKHLIGPKLRARTLIAQQGEAALAVAVLNRMIRTAKLGRFMALVLAPGQAHGLLHAPPGWLRARRNQVRRLRAKPRTWRATAMCHWKIARHRCPRQRPAKQALPRTGPAGSRPGRAANRILLRAASARPRAPLPERHEVTTKEELRRVGSEGVRPAGSAMTTALHISTAARIKGQRTPTRCRRVRMPGGLAPGVPVMSDA